MRAERRAPGRRAGIGLETEVRALEQRKEAPPALLVPRRTAPEGRDQEIGVAPGIGGGVRGGGGDDPPAERMLRMNLLFVASRSAIASADLAGEVPHEPGVRDGLAAAVLRLTHLPGRG